MNLLMAVLAFVFLVAFLAILVIHVPRLDLIGVVGITLALAAWDLYTTFGRRSRSG
ncbi:hypothetical protein [Paracoccus subflavus]|uniref:hypothetical protein n=1 Tax=Paracoccus subflavus TaxID=2528244 RepID=UPI0013EEFACE|nr:hypothetical protein [Paracoccus subflavus]